MNKFRKIDLIPMRGREKIKLEIEMKKIKLNEISEKPLIDGYRLDPTEKYVIDMDAEKEFQIAIVEAFQIMGSPPALKNYHAWLRNNNFSLDMPNPTNKVVAPFYGVKPLWKTEYSQGVVVRAEDDDDYYIVMECSNKNKGYKRSEIIVTLGGCM